MTWLSILALLCSLTCPATSLGIGSLNLLTHRSAAPKSSLQNRAAQRVGELWLPQDIYAGSTFFDNFTFWEQADPTKGQVSYVNSSTAFANGLAYVQADGAVVMKGDDFTVLPPGAARDSVRITSNANYTGGLFILDLNQAPWGCGVWPAWWTVGPNWPGGGEIDIIEGVHDNTHNQVTWHTNPGCSLTNTGNYTGTKDDCDANVDDNAGCGVTDWSRDSYGPQFDAGGGGIYAMLWDETGIAVWYFYRNAIPDDITNLSPQPSGWSEPSAYLSPQNCNLTEFFYQHQIVFDITFCGVWAGNSYATSGCPGTCSDRIQDPNNFVNASWSINSLRVYSKEIVYGASGSLGGPAAPSIQVTLLASLTLCVLALLLL
ncbi:hypothetical protein SISSUDRAFT_7203 [Sistotremastrum suecicum HHB10207 ss-3]|uniref:GH16 domain-containing protein n=1 Tax=Sistotremastrum suecicum HHB10207 ss-3 TaxID=1314776 RepID=A0A166J4I8_9AGAM|nr:hypothetical protein SISSUDRAFT_7203 [Sistotremastrum suecicum HHB10207 ss-3]